MVLFATSAFAFQPEDIYGALDRMDKLAEFKAPERSGLSNIDALAAKAETAAANAFDITNTLHKYYYLTGGELPEGLVYVGNAPTLEEVEAISGRIKEQSKLVSESATLIANATGDLKGAKPLAIAKAKKSISASSDIFKVVAEDTKYETELLQQVMANLSK